MVYEVSRVLFEGETERTFKGHGVIELVQLHWWICCRNSIFFLLFFGRNDHGLTVVSVVDSDWLIENVGR